ncbi:MAG: PSP1 domain-containing protein, partial [Gemmatimonadota bacterium]
PTPGPAAPAAVQLVEVLFKGKRREYFHSRLEPALGVLEYVVVEAERGQDLGVVTALDILAERKCRRCDRELSEPAKKVLRRAAQADVERALSLRAEEPRVREQTRVLAEEHGLKMKVSDAEWQWDRNKLILYFTAEKRVDFRELVRKLASTFHTRIELRQIGVRDEAKRLDGVGRCGRALCSSNWLPDLKPVTLQLAKDQNLSLNPSQISGACGRLMCCLRYEHEFYLQARKRFPRIGKTLVTARGTETVVAHDLFREQISLKSAQGETRVVLLEALKAEIASARG